MRKLLLLLPFLFALQACGSADDAAFEKAKASGKVADCNAYLLEFPEGSHLREIATLKDDFSYAAARAEIEGGSPFCHHFQSYLDDFPDGLHRREAASQMEDCRYCHQKLKMKSDNYYPKPSVIGLVFNTILLFVDVQNTVEMSFIKLPRKSYAL